jgi:hypothetical protein
VTLSKCVAEFSKSVAEIFYFQQQSAIVSKLIQKNLAIQQHSAVSPKRKPVTCPCARQQKRCSRACAGPTTGPSWGSSESVRYIGRLTLHSEGKYSIRFCVCLSTIYLCLHVNRLTHLVSIMENIPEGTFQCG